MTKNRRAQKTPAVSVELIVRRGALRRFDKLKQATATLPVKVLWDRRTADQGSAPGRVREERPERRQRPPFTWDTADFVVVENPDGETGSGTK